MRSFIILFIFFKVIPSYSQEHLIDTLYLRHDDPLLSIEKHVSSSARVYRIKGTGTNGFTYFLEGKSYKSLAPKQTFYLNDILKNSNIYNKYGLIDNLKLFKYLEKYVIFIETKKGLYHINMIYEIE